MGMGSQQAGQVYYDPAKGQYYTISGNGFWGGISNNARRNYIGESLNQQKTPSSNISNLVQQAMSAQANPVSMAQLFPYMNYGATNNMGANIGGLGGLLGMTGSSGAGRFLSAPTSNQSTTM